MRRWFLRIYPGFLVAVTFDALVVGPLASATASDYWQAFSPLRFVVQALNLQEVGFHPLFAANSTHALNGSLWSIRYEFFCYLGVAAMGLAGVLRRRVLVLLAFLGCLAVYALQVQRGWQVPGSRWSWLYCYPDFWPRLAACFLAGALFYLYRESIRYSWPRFAAAVVGLAVLGAVPSLRCLVLAVPILGGFAFFYLGFLPIRRLHGFARRGDLSYGMYLYACPIQQLLVQQFGPSLHPLVLFPLATVVTALCAWMSWTFVERPFINLKATRVPLDPPPMLTGAGERAVLLSTALESYGRPGSDGVRRARRADRATPDVTSEGPRVEPDA
jgi:peptidoglycan/LPS O-acetylase OafA/YrhL